MKSATYQGSPCKRGHAGVRLVRTRDCVDCVNERGRERWSKDPDHRERWLAHRRAKYATDGGREYRRERNLLWHYGITLDDYNRMLAEQNGKCAICGGDEADEQYGRLHVDHDHDTQKVRSLLCSRCNRGLGAFQDSPKVAEAAAAYLRKHGKL